MNRDKGVENVNQLTCQALVQESSGRFHSPVGGLVESSAHLGAQVPHDARHDDAGAREDEQVEALAIEHPADEGDQRDEQEVERDDHDRVRDAHD